MMSLGDKMDKEEINKLFREMVDDIKYLKRMTYRGINKKIK